MPQASPELPPAMPTVVFDRGVARNVDFVDFDYQEFYTMAQSSGATDEQIEAFTVRFVGKNNRSLFGRYNTRQKAVMIYPSTEVAIGTVSPFHKVDAGNLSEAEVADLTLRHETGHWIADITNEPGELWRKRQNLKSRLLEGSIATFSVTMPFTSHAEATVFPVLTGLAVWIGGGIRNQIKYRHPWDTPHERFAYTYEAATRDYAIVRYIGKQSV